jgi:hypothetical protein
MQQPDREYDDIIELARIKYKLSIDAKQLDILANQTEEDYNLAR